MPSHPRHRRPAIIALLVALAASLAACSSDDTAAGTETGNTVAATKCTFGLVTLQTSQDTSCGGGNTHKWPIGMAATDCHGWRSLDNNGKQHDNSANTIQCNSDGSFSFLQYAGNLTCGGTGVLKTYPLNKCEQDTPPNLYTKAVDLTCCSDPQAAGCAQGVPSASVSGTTIFLNGDLCGG